MNAAIPKSGDLVQRIRDYLAAADLHLAKEGALTTLLGVPARTIQHRLHQANTNWQSLKREERQRRLQVLLATPGRIHSEDLMQKLGYTDDTSFFRFFRQSMGETFTDWRMRRQRE